MAGPDPLLLGTFEIFRAFGEGDLKTLSEAAQTRRIAKGGAMFRQGGEPHEAFVVLEGRFKVVQVTPGGEQVIMRIVGPGEPCGMAVMLGLAAYPATAIAAGEGVVAAWRSEEWRRLCEAMPALAVATLHVVGGRLQDAHARIRESSTEPAERRVARAILRLIATAGRSTDDGTAVDFPVTRQDIAEMAGVTLHTVSRLISAWKERGLLSGGRQRIVVPDPQRLASLAEGEPSDK